MYGISQVLNKLVSCSDGKVFTPPHKLLCWGGCDAAEFFQISLAANADGENLCNGFEAWYGGCQPLGILCLPIGDNDDDSAAASVSAAAVCQQLLRYNLQGTACIGGFSRIRERVDGRRDGRLC